MPERPNIDIRPDHWEIVRSLLQKNVPQYEVWAFGSRATWTAKDHSDLDLAVITNQPMALSVSASLSDDFSESDLPWKVDVVDWATTSESFRKIIARDKVVVQAAPRDCAGEQMAWGAELDHVIRLDELALINPKRRVSKGTAIPFIEMAALPTHSRDIDDSLVVIRESRGAGAHFQNGDTLLARITPCLENGKTAQVRCLKDSETGEGSTEFIVLCGIDQADSDFVYYLCRAPGFRDYAIGRMEGSSGRQRVSWQSISAFQFPCPSPSERRAAAIVLGALDDRITLLRETNATLEAIAQALFKSWFVDFDPVRAKMEGRSPEGMDEATAALFPDGFEESERGLVPKGWRLVPFGELLCYTIGGDWGSDVPDEKNDARVAIIRGTDIPDLQSGANIRVPVRYTSQKKLETRKLADGDIVLEVSGGSKDQPTGRALYLTANLLGQFDCPVEPASFCRLLRPNSKNIGKLLSQHLTYIYAQGKTWEYQNQSTGIANFQTTHFLETELVAVPSDYVLTAFAETIRPMVDRAHLTQLQDLANLRDTLLPRLISGQLRLPEAQPGFDAGQM
jgi:type I restriction enzyme S subunit